MMKINKSAQGQTVADARRIEGMLSDPSGTLLRVNYWLLEWAYGHGARIQEMPNLFQTSDTLMALHREIGLDLYRRMSYTSTRKEATQVTNLKTEDRLPYLKPQQGPLQAQELRNFMVWQASPLPPDETHTENENGEGEGNVSEETRTMLEADFFRGLR